MRRDSITKWQIRAEDLVPWISQLFLHQEKKTKKISTCLSKGSIRTRGRCRVYWVLLVTGSRLWNLSHQRWPFNFIQSSLQVKFTITLWPLSLEKEMATHSCILAWRIPWTEEPGRLQSMGSQRVRHDGATSLPLLTFTHWRRKWQPTPVSLPRESQGQRSLVGCRQWGHTESDTTEGT